MNRPAWAAAAAWLVLAGVVPAAGVPVHEELMPMAAPAETAPESSPAEEDTLPVAAAAETAPVEAPEEPEPKEETIIFRWYDEQGIAHDTTDPQSIPPGVKVRIAGPQTVPVDPKKTRRWWRARLARLQAALHAAQDRKAVAEKALADAVKSGVPVTEREPWRKKLTEASEAEKRARSDIDAFQKEAKDRKIPERWLR